MTKTSSWHHDLAIYYMWPITLNGWMLLNENCLLVLSRVPIRNARTTFGTIVAIFITNKSTTSNMSTNSAPIHSRRNANVLTKGRFVLEEYARQVRQLLKAHQQHKGWALLIQMYPAQKIRMWSIQMVRPQQEIPMSGFHIHPQEIPGCQIHQQQLQLMVNLKFENKKV